MTRSEIWAKVAAAEAALPEARTFRGLCWCLDIVGRDMLFDDFAKEEARLWRAGSTLPYNGTPYFWPFNASGRAARQAHLRAVRER